MKTAHDELTRDLLMNELTTRYPCDLHCHTTRSDGHDSPLELIENAAKLGMTAVAITDHDIDPPTVIALPDGRVVDSSGFAAEHNLNLVLGYEFSTNTYVDDVHILGYNLDWQHPDLQAEVAAAAESKVEGYRELCRRLTQAGMPIDWQSDILNYTTTSGEPGLRNPDEVQRKHVFEAMAAKGYTQSWSDAKRFVRDNPELNVLRRKIDSWEAINLIHRCGGIAILAHPYLIDEQVVMPGLPVRSRSEFIDGLIDAGLDGIEASYTYDKTTYKGSLQPAEIEAEIRQRYASRLRFISGGSDYHADHKKGAQRARSLGERGITVDAFEVIKPLLLR